MAACRSLYVNFLSVVATIFLIRTSNSNEILFNKVVFKKWTDYFLFLALVASTRSKYPKETDRERWEGAVLIDAETFKVCVHFLKLTILFSFYWHFYLVVLMQFNLRPSLPYSGFIVIIDAPRLYASRPIRPYHSVSTVPYPWLPFS